MNGLRKLVVDSASFMYDYVCPEMGIEGVIDVDVAAMPPRAIKVEALAAVPAITPALLSSMFMFLVQQKTR